jgi:hypothetical protein
MNVIGLSRAWVFDMCLISIICELENLYYNCLEVVIVGTSSTIFLYGKIARKPASLTFAPLPHTTPVTSLHLHDCKARRKIMEIDSSMTLPFLTALPSLSGVLPSPVPHGSCPSRSDTVSPIHHGEPADAGEFCPWQLQPICRK